MVHENTYTDREKLQVTENKVLVWRIHRMKQDYRRKMRE